MKWLFALVPVALCGAMCVGGAVLAALGVRRSRARAGCCPPGSERAKPDPTPEVVDR